MQITADVSKISKTFQRDLTFIFNVLSKSLFGFVSYSVFQAVEKVVSFTKTHFYRERGCPTMRNCTKTFQHNHGYNIYHIILKAFDKIFVLQKTEMCDPSSKCHNSETRGSTTPCSYIFLNLLQFLYQFHYLKGKSLKR